MEKKKVIKEFSSVISTLNLESELDLPAKTLAEFLFKQLEILPLIHRERAEIAAMALYCHNPQPIPETHKKESNNTVNDFVDRMYEIYPARCPKRNTSTGKSRKDKDRIKRLLKVYTEEQIEQVIRAEVDNNYGVNYMKNFSTFLNNFPEPSTETPKVGSKKDEPFTLNGIRYQ
jgi:hypothetical protein